METLVSLPFAVLECPNIKLKKPSWLHMPSAMTVYAVVIVSYFLITGGESAVLACYLCVCVGVLCKLTFTRSFIIYRFK